LEGRGRGGENGWSRKRYARTGFFHNLIRTKSHEKKKIRSRRARKRFEKRKRRSCPFREEHQQVKTKKNLKWTPPRPFGMLSEKQGKNEKMPLRSGIKYERFDKGVAGHDLEKKNQACGRKQDSHGLKELLASTWSSDV